MDGDMMKIGEFLNGNQIMLCFPRILPHLF